jgi:hypothetical protein
MRLFIFFCVLSFTFSCNKKKELEFSIDGSILDESFSAPLNDASVYILKKPIGGTFVNVKLSSTITDNNGKFSLVFPREKVESYMLVIEKENYFTVEEIVTFSQLSTEKALKLELKTTAKAWAKIRLVNVNPVNSNDILKIIKMQGKDNCPECCTKNEQFFYGALDSTFYCINNGNSNYSFYHWIMNSPEQAQHTFYTPAFDTVEYVLTY